jgi:hypothetical protein
MGRSYLIFFIVLLLISCDNNKKPRQYRLAKDPLENTVIDKLPVKEKNNFTWDAPGNWIIKENNSFSLASYEIPYQNDSADLSITKFSGDAGGVLANVNRWRRQLDLEPQTLKEINATSIIGSSMIGNFSVYKIINEQQRQAFLCAILPYANSTIFIKLKSGIITTNALEKKFLDFCSSFKSSK